MTYIEKFLNNLSLTHKDQNLFLQSTSEILNSIKNVINNNLKLKRYRVLERICTPERQISFKITWKDDKNHIRINNGYRIGFNSNLGPYKGGLRFHPSVNVNVIKFLAFEQTFKNSLTGLNIGGGKGGSDFNPKKKSTSEVMNFCQNFITELGKYLGSSEDVPAGDIGVNSSLIDYMFSYYKKIFGFKPETFTGKSIYSSGSFIRKESTGFGCAYFAKEAFEYNNWSLKAKTAIVSGSGNVAIYLMEKLSTYHVKILACSDSTGILIDREGIEWRKIKFIKEVLQQNLAFYVSLRKKAEFIETTPLNLNKTSIWNIPCDLAFPCATQNELNLIDAKNLVKNKCKLIVEGANMPCTNDAIHFFQQNKITFIPSKAANSGGVITSYLEMQQNARLTQWTSKTVDIILAKKIKEVHDNCIYYAQMFKRSNDYIFGANLYSFLRLSDSYLRFGLI